MQWLLPRIGSINIGAISCIVHALRVHARQARAAIIVLADEAHTATHLRCATLAPERWSLHARIHHARSTLHEVIGWLVLRLELL